MSETKEQFDLQKQWSDLQKTNEDLIEAKAAGHATAFKEEILAKQEERFSEMSDKVNDLTAAVNRKALVADAVDEAKDATEEYSVKFDEWMRSGDESLKNELSGLETKDLSAGGAANAGGNAVATPIQQAISRILKASSPMRSLAKVQKTSTSVFEKNFGQNDAASGWVAETAARPKTTTPTLEKVSITAFEQYAMPIITQTLLDDQYFNVESWVAEEVAEQFARLENLAFASGTGTGQPDGFLNNMGVAGAGHTWGTYETILTGAAGSPDVITEDDITSLPYQMIADYRRGGKFVMNRQVLSHIRSLKDTNGAYIWVPGFGATPDTILGYSVVEMEDMSATMNQGDLALAFGDFSKGYGIVDRVGMRMLRDPYTERPSIAYYTTKRVGGGVLDSNAIIGLEVG